MLQNNIFLYYLKYFKIRCSQIAYTVRRYNKIMKQRCLMSPSKLATMWFILYYGIKYFI